MTASPDSSTRLGLPWLMPAQAQKHVTHNEALRRLDALVQAAVESRSVAEEPSAPAEGQGWIVAEGASGAHWSGFQAGDLVVFQDGAWARFQPAAGWRVWVIDTGELAIFDGTAWQGFTPGEGEAAEFLQLGVGTAPDDANPFSAKLNVALWAARSTGEGGTGDLRYTLNKEGPGHVLSLLFQSGWEGRAEIGLVGDDDVVFKVSDDGSAWKEALRLDRASGVADFPKGASLRGLSVLRAETLALLDAFDVPVASFAEALAYDRLISTLIRADVWQKLNGLWVLWAHDEQAARVNLSSPQQAATNVNAMSFIPGRGFTGNGVNTCLDTGFNPASDGNGRFTRNNAHVSTWIEEDTGTPGAGNGVVGGFGGGSSTSGALWLFPRRFASTARARLNTGAGIWDAALPADSSEGFTLISRSSADLVETYKDGDLLASHASSAQDPRSASFTIGSAAGEYSDALHGAASIGAGLTAAEVQALYRALARHRHEAGALVHN